MSALPGRHGVVDELNRIRRPGVLGELVGVEIEPARHRIDHDVLEHRAEAAGHRVDLRFRLRRQTNRLRVTAAFEVEHAVVAPPVLVVADQPAGGVARQRGLSSAREPEEEGRVAVRTDVRRAVHREHAAQRQQVVQRAEDRLLDLAGVARATDEHQPFGEVQRDHHLGVGAVADRVGLERWAVDDGELRHVPGHIVEDEEVAREQAVPGVLGDDADGEPVAAVGAGVTVLHEQLGAAQRRQQVLVQAVEVLDRHRPVRAAPGDVLLARRFPDDELVVRRAAGVVTGSADQRAFSGHEPFAAADGLLVQHGITQIPVRLGVVDTFLFEAAARVDGGSHEVAPKRRQGTDIPASLRIVLAGFVASQ